MYSHAAGDASSIGASTTTGGVIRKFAVGLLGAAAVAATVLLVRQQKEVEPKERKDRLVQAGETKPTISLERIRELGL